MKQTLLLILGIILILFTICWLASLRTAGKFDDETAKCFTVIDEDTGYGHKHGCYDVGYIGINPKEMVPEDATHSQEIALKK